MSTQLQHAASLLASDIAGQDVAVVLQLLSAKFSGAVTFSTSFSKEDQVITHLLQQHAPDATVFTLDTGRFFKQTYDVWASTNAHFGIKIDSYFPERLEIEKYLDQNGPNAFYQSVELRKECCHIRKVEPLKRALAGYSVWITGLRAAHSSARQSLKKIEWDEAHQIIKYNPLLHWNDEEIDAYIRKYQLPYNSLHDKGYVSIGCEPCTRAIRPGEDFRAGRWWWEDSTKKECGLHTSDVSIKN